ncbi:cereblon family protein [Litorivivens sp.]|uniref:cereblon family protein n=1 Tax=Litorivivens sp. TaxID=2020868 RepID=UPI003566D493
MATEDTILPSWLDDCLSMEERQPEDFILCSLCLSPITHKEARLSVQGAHEHRVVNPHNITFQLACFDTAPGCSISGEPTPAFSWFRTFYWQYATCSECHEHMGWYYENPDHDSFFGLIISRLAISG